MGKQILGLFFGLFLFTAPVVAQIYNGKAEAILAPLDAFVEVANNIQEPLGIPGDDIDGLPQEELYEVMTEPLNNSIEKHFQMGEEYQAK